MFANGLTSAKALVLIDRGKTSNVNYVSKSLFDPQTEPRDALLDTML